MIKSLASSNLISGFSPENILEAFLAGTNDGFLVLDKDFRVVTFNDKYNQYHQLYYGKFVEAGALIEDLTPPKKLRERMAYLERCLEGEVIKFTIKCPSVSSTPSWYDVEFNPLKGRYGEIIGVGVGAFETTEKHQTLEKLSQSEELFKALIQNSTDAFQLCNNEFELIFTSATIKNVLGFESSELIGKNGLEMAHPDEQEQVAAWFKKVREHDEKLFSIEYRIKNREGNWIWVENYGSNLLSNPNVQAVVMTLRNIQAKKIADFALIQAEQRLSLLLNNTDESFIILNSRLKIVSYNRAAQQHSPYFYCGELQSGVSVLDLIEASEIESLISLFEKVFEGEEMERQTIFTDKENNEHIFCHMYRPLYSEGREISGVFITSTDITKRKHAEQQVKESEIRFRTIIQESFDAVLITDDTTNISYSSPSIINVLGYTAEELTGNTAFNYMHADDLQPAISKFAEVMLNPNSERNIDVRMRNNKGDYVWIELKGKNMFDNHYVQGILVSLRDITSRKKAKELISLSEQRFKGLVQSGADMIWILNEHAELIYASPTVKTILDITPKTKYGQSLFCNVHADDRTLIKKQVHDFIQSGERQIQVGPYRFVNENGKAFWLDSTITNLLNDPSIGGIVLNSRDVTERKKLTEEQKALTEELLRNNQDLQQFSFITSHNLRAPVANLISLLSLYNRQNPADDFNPVLIEKFEEATLQLNSTLNDLVNVLVIKSNNTNNKQVISLSEVYKGVRLNIENLLFQENGKLKADFSEVDQIETNKIHIESIFLNLISNAIRYRSEQRDPVIKIRSYRQDNWIVVRFEDNGLGMDLKRYGDRLFGLYQRFHTTKEGKGLGLYMTKSQVMAMGGKIEVESELEKGTIFTIFFKS